MDRRTRDFCWRLDHANDSHSFHTYEDCPYVENWLHGLPLSGNSEYAIHFIDYLFFNSAII